MASAAALVALATGSLAAADRPQLDAIRTDAKTPHFYDQHGRVRIFHGVNGVHKGFPWYPDWLLNETLVKELSEWGMNAIRVGWMMTGFEPADGQFNETYFEMSQKVTDTLAKYGIHSLLDTHQDCMSSLFCTYDGLPQWLVNRSKPTHPFPWPYHGNCSSRGWGTNCLTEAADRAYQNLYDNNYGMRDSFVQFWKESAKRWAGDTNVLGLELINEPFAGDVYRDPTLFLPGQAGRKNLMPLYDAVAAGIREYDADHVIFYEPVTWGMVMEGKIVGSGFSHVPGGDDFRNRSCLSYHYYCKSFGGNPKLCDPVVGPLVFDSVGKDIASNGGSSMLTEFGGCDGNDLPECTTVMDLADKHLQSWTEYDGFGQGGAFPRPAYIDTLARTYARAIAGEPISMKYDAASASFELCFTIAASIAAPTEIFVPPRHYTNGTAVTATANLKVDAAPSADNVVTAVPASAAADGQKGCVQIKRA
eukprot:TRINITY_DN378_c0_g1_i1.p1 TRINITY_DN378_c0_g1~~TRINITY_DN378_c0_g1_i1.p1  ORF type:complete len:496 (+),score=181.11 TRINITY_DN378_c0_g1_i1:63-1490(+)